MTGSVEQIVGLILLAVGGTMLWSAWALVICGALALLLPEIAQARR